LERGGGTDVWRVEAILKRDTGKINL